MKIIWIGQAGLLIETGELKILVDPYLSDSVAKVNPKNHRRIPVNNKVFDEKPDVILLTHDHLDHLDPETLSVFFDTDKCVTVLAPYNAWGKSRKYGREHNYVIFNSGTVWTQGDITFTAVSAEHSDKTAVGCIIDDEKRKIYITGDTLYNKKIFEDLPDDIYAVFLPINGVGNNMNIADAKKFVKKTGAKYAVPVHFGMFDNIDPHEFDVDNAVIPKLYEQINFGEK